MHHKMLTQRTFFAITRNTKGMLSQHFVTHVVPPLAWLCLGHRPLPKVMDKQPYSNLHSQMDNQLAQWDFAKSLASSCYSLKLF